jgi:hypothetical protein
MSIISYENFKSCNGCVGLIIVAPSSPLPENTCHSRLLVCQIITALASTPLFVHLVIFFWDSSIFTRSSASADDPALKAALENYHRQGLTSNKRISELLKAEYDIEIMSVIYCLLLPCPIHISDSPLHDILYSRDSAVKRCRKKLNLTGSRVTTATIPYDQALQHILAEMDADISNSRGLANVKSRIAYNKLTHLSRDFISEVMTSYTRSDFRYGV